MPWRIRVINIERVEGYSVPTDEELVDQQIEQLVCETCRCYDHCFMGNCIAYEEERQRTETRQKNTDHVRDENGAR